MKNSLSDYITYVEMVRSQTATRLGIDNTPTEDHLANMRCLCERILDPIRSHFGQALNPSSGYRCPELNTIIGGDLKSQHLKGEAADFGIARTPEFDVWKWIVAESDLPFDQCIAEFLSSPSGGWIHVSHKKDGENRGKITVARKVNGKTVYTNYTKQEILDGDYVL